MHTQTVVHAVDRLAETRSRERSSLTVAAAIGLATLLGLYLALGRYILIGIGLFNLVAVVWWFVWLYIIKPENDQESESTASIPER